MLVGSYSNVKFGIPMMEISHFLSMASSFTFGVRIANRANCESEAFQRSSQSGEQPVTCLK